MAVTVRAPEAELTVYPELSVVRLRHPVRVEARRLPKGAPGTVVAAYADGRGYDVEFNEPFQAVVTLDANDLT